ncbi:MAG: VVA0879 family protein [Candidatus Babeliales bacterium]|jgi:hypothetical protein
MELSKNQLFERAEKLYGKDRCNWKFKCPNCGNIQSGNTIREQMLKNIGSMRHGIIQKGEGIYLDCECYSPTCNWVAYGLFNSGILMIIDSSLPHNEATKENCGYIFPLADDKEMLEAAGLIKES